MERLQLDYQSPPRFYQRPAWLFLGVSLVMGGILTFISMTLDHDNEALGQQVSNLRKRSYELVRAASVSPSEERKTSVPGDLAEHIEKHSLHNWERLFFALESAASDSLTLLELVPDRDEISISGEAKSFAAVSDYIRRLNETAVIADTHLTTSEVDAKHPQRPIRFSLHARWRRGGYE